MRRREVEGGKVRTYGTTVRDRRTAGMRRQNQETLAERVGRGRGTFHVRRGIDMGVDVDYWHFWNLWNLKLGNSWWGRLLDNMPGEGV